MRISDWSSDVCSSDLPLQLAVLALSYRQRLDRRLHADDRLRDGRGDGQYLSGALVCGRDRGGDRGGRHPVPAGNLQARYRGLTGDQAAAVTSHCRNAAVVAATAAGSTQRASSSATCVKRWRDREGVVWGKSV